MTEQNDDIIAMEADDTPITMPRGILIAVLDIAVTSMDFGSGFLQDADVEALRRLAVAVGTDPLYATPSTHTCKYTGTHGNWCYYPEGWGALVPNGGYVCTLCHTASEERPDNFYDHQYVPYERESDFPSGRLNMQRCEKCGAITTADYIRYETSCTSK